MFFECADFGYRIDGETDLKRAGAVLIRRLRRLHGLGNQNER